jgi:hypothetical protein
MSEKMTSFILRYHPSPHSIPGADTAEAISAYPVIQIDGPILDPITYDIGRIFIPFDSTTSPTTNSPILYTRWMGHGTDPMHLLAFTSPRSTTVFTSKIHLFLGAARAYQAGAKKISFLYNPISRGPAAPHVLFTIHRCHTLAVHLYASRCTKSDPFTGWASSINWASRSVDVSLCATFSTSRSYRAKFHRFIIRRSDPDSHRPDPTQTPQTPQQEEGQTDIIETSRPNKHRRSNHPSHRTPSSPSQKTQENDTTTRQSIISHTARRVGRTSKSHPWISHPIKPNKSTVTGALYKTPYQASSRRQARWTLAAVC